MTLLVDWRSTTPIVAVIDVFVPVTARGRLYALVIERLVAWKRLVKQTPWALRTANALRTAKASLLA